MATFATWLFPRSRRSRANTPTPPATEFCPSVSSDGATFYFTSTRVAVARQRPRDYGDLTARLRGIENGLGNVYTVPMSVIRPNRGL